MLPLVVKNSSSMSGHDSEAPRGAETSGIMPDILERPWTSPETSDDGPALAVLEIDYS